MEGLDIGDVELAVPLDVLVQAVAVEVLWRVECRVEGCWSDVVQRFGVVNR